MQINSLNTNTAGINALLATSGTKKNFNINTTLHDTVAFSSAKQISLGETKTYNEEATQKLRTICDENHYNAFEEIPWPINKLFCRSVKKLIEQGADPNTNIGEFHPLDMVLMSCDSPDTIQFLLEHGADPDFVNEFEESALDFAYSLNRTKSVPILDFWERAHQAR